MRRRSMEGQSREKGSFFAGLIGKIVVVWASANAWLREDRGRVTGPPSTKMRDLPELSSFFSLVLLVAASLAFVSWGLFVYSTVGPKWPPSWNFGIVEDLPGSSVYSTGVGTRFGVEPNRLRIGPPEPQHVMGRKEESLEAGQ